MPPLHRHSHKYGNTFSEPRMLMPFVWLYFYFAITVGALASKRLKGEGFLREDLLVVRIRYEGVQSANIKSKCASVLNLQYCLSPLTLFKTMEKGESCDFRFDFKGTNGIRRSISTVLVNTTLCALRKFGFDCIGAVHTASQLPLYAFAFLLPMCKSRRKVSNSTQNIF